MNGISSLYAELIRTLIGNPDRWEIHSFMLNDMHEITYGDSTVVPYTDTQYLVTNEKHGVDFLTDDAIEALETAAVWGYKCL